MPDGLGSTAISTAAWASVCLTSERPQAVHKNWPAPPRPQETDTRGSQGLGVLVSRPALFVGRRARKSLRRHQPEHQHPALTGNLPVHFIRPTSLAFIDTNGVDALLVG